MFIETLENVIVPVSQIRRIGAPYQNKHGAWVRSVIINDEGSSFTILAAAADKLTAAIIPASPGYELLIRPDSKDPEFFFFRTPIIAWRINYLDGNPAPVTVGNDENLEGQPHGILMPDGKVEVQHDTTFDSLADWEKSIRHEHEAARAENGTNIATRGRV